MCRAHTEVVTMLGGLGDSVQDFTSLILQHCGMSEELAAAPITFQDVVYGEQEPRFTEFMVRLKY